MNIPTIIYHDDIYYVWFRFHHIGTYKTYVKANQARIKWMKHRA